MKAASLRRLAPLVLGTVLTASPAFAQGNSQAAKGRGAKPPSSQPATDSGSPGQPVVPGTGVRHFGVWLDDASILPKGRGWTTFGFGYWRSMFGHQWDLPTMDAGVAIHPRVQVSASAPLSHASYDSGYSSRGMGDVYVSGKIGLIDPDRPGRRFGVAVIPVLEILSSGSNLEGEGRLHWALPVSVERRFDGFRAYAAGGYFSRGALFGSGAVEVPLTDKLIATGVLSHSRSLTTDPLSDALELSRTRFDLAGGAAWILNPTTVLFGSLGRTISRADANASSLAFTAGISVGFTTLNPPRR